MKLILITCTDLSCRNRALVKAIGDDADGFEFTDDSTLTNPQYKCENSTDKPLAPWEHIPGQVETAELNFAAVKSAAIEATNALSALWDAESTLEDVVGVQHDDMEKLLQDYVEAGMEHDDRVVFDFLSRFANYNTREDAN